MALGMSENMSVAEASRDGLKSTAYPTFAEEEVPEAIPSDVEDEPEKRLKFKTKEDQDVAVFMAIANKMSLTSLMHIMQGHALAMSLPYEHIKRDAEQMFDSSQAGEPEIKPVVKKFRFDLVGDEVRCEVFKIKPLKDMKELWFSPDEMNDVRYDAIQVVNFFRRHRKDYMASVDFVANAFRNKTPEGERMLEQQMKQLIRDSYARGLEAHIVKSLTARRGQAVRAVLMEQKECRICADSYDVTSDCLRDQSVVYSDMSMWFAEKMAECDHIDALKACLSNWEAERQQE